MFKYLLSILIIIVFSTIFITEQDIPNGLIESKSYGFLFISICLCFILLLSLSFTKTFRLQISKIDITLLLFLIWIIFNAFIINKLPSSITIEVFICSVVLALILKQSILIDSQYQLYFSIACLIVGGSQGLLGILQLYGFQESLHSSFKMTGSFHNPGPFGIYIATIFVFALGNYLYAENFVLKNTSALVCLVGILVLPSTQSRSAWIGLIGGSIYLLFIKYGLEKKRHIINKFTIAGLIVFTAIVAIALWSFKKNSALGRTLTWRISSEMVKENPVTGIGLGEFPYQYGFFQADFFRNNPSEEHLINLADKNSYAFNDLLQMIVENGLIGVVLFVLIIFFVFFIEPKIHTNYLFASRAGVITVLLASCFSYPFELIPIWWLVLFFICLISINSKDIYSGVPLIYTKVFVNLSFALLATYVITYEMKVYQAKQMWKAGDFAVQQQDYKEAEKLYQGVINKLPRERQVLLSYGKVLYMNGKIKQSVNILEKVSQTIADPFLLINLGNSYQVLKKYNLAEKAYINASNMIPNRMYPKYLLAKMYLQNQDTLRSKELARKIIRMPVKIPSQATIQMKEEMEQLLR